MEEQSVLFFILINECYIKKITGSIEQRQVAHCFLISISILISIYDIILVLSIKVYKHISGRDSENKKAFSNKLKALNYLL
jgi:hypothetical protein